MQTLEFDLSISASDYQTRYQTIADVIVVARNGQSLRFPANSLQRFVAHDGVHGSFRIVFDDEFHLVDLKRIT